ncbi:MAG: helix-turn-helix domain-containing protein [Candidatus Polarisedimenticolia bacterium]
MKSTRYVPVTMGASAFLRRDLPGLRVVELRFAPHVLLPPHEHDRASFFVMLEGGIEMSMSSRTFTCLPTVTTVEPPGARHTNQMSPQGARLLVIQPDVIERPLPLACESLLAAPSQLKSSRLFHLAWALARELEFPGKASDLYVEGLACEMLAHAVRHRANGATRRRPAWLARVEELLREKFLEGVSLGELARVAGVHRVHLVRTFREHNSTSPGAYQRELRLQWASDRLAHSDDPLGLIAHEAGFTDQSHFCRMFRRFTGLTPSRFRQNRRR